MGGVGASHVDRWMMGGVAFWAEEELAPALHVPGLSPSTARGKRQLALRPAEGDGRGRMTEPHQAKEGLAL